MHILKALMNLLNDLETLHFLHLFRELGLYFLGLHFGLRYLILQFGVCDEFPEDLFLKSLL